MAASDYRYKSIPLNPSRSEIRILYPRYTTVEDTAHENGRCVHHLQLDCAIPFLVTLIMFKFIGSIIELFFRSQIPRGQKPQV